MGWFVTYKRLTDTNFSSDHSISKSSAHLIKGYKCVYPAGFTFVNLLHHSTFNSLTWIIILSFCILRFAWDNNGNQKIAGDCLFVFPDEAFEWYCIFKFAIKQKSSYKRPYSWRSCHLLPIQSERFNIDSSVSECSIKTNYPQFHLKW